MIWSNLISTLYHKVGQEMSSELYDDNDLVFAINLGLDIIESESQWGFRNTSVELVAPSGTTNTFTSTYNLYTVFWAKGYLTSSTSSEDAEILEQRQIINEEDTDTNQFVLSYNGVTTSKDYYKVELFCNHGMLRIENTDVSKASTITLPTIIINAVLEIALAYLMPTYLDTGYELSKFHYNNGLDYCSRARRLFATQKTDNNVTVKYK